MPDSHSPTSQNRRVGSGKSKGSVVSSAVITALLSSHAMDLGQLLIVFRDTLIGTTTQSEYQVEAGLLVLGLGFIVLLVMNAKKALSSGEKEDHEALSVSIIVGLIGGAFSILDKTSNSFGVPQTATFEGLFYLAIVSLIFVPPVLFLPWTRQSRTQLTMLSLRLGLAALAALTLTATLMLTYYGIGQIYSCEEINGVEFRCGYLSLGSTSFFLSAPVIATLVAPWSLLAVDPLVRRERWSAVGKKWPIAWLISFLVAGSLLSLYFALSLYYPKHGEPGHGWMRAGPFDPITSVQTVLFFLALHLPSLMGAAWSALVLKPQEGRPWIRNSDSLSLGAVAVVATIAASYVAWNISGRAGMESGNLGFFVFSHAFTALSTAAAVIIAYRLPAKSSVSSENAE